MRIFQCANIYFTDQDRHKVPFTLKGVPVVNHFIGRSDEMRQLEQHLLPEPLKPMRRKVFVLYGLGGIGKTQLSVEFARKHHDRYSAALWLDGSSNDQLKGSFVRVARRLPADELTPNVSVSLQTSNVDADVVVEDVRRWLSLPSNRNWLLIIDNVDRDLGSRDPQAYDIQKYLPEADHGSTIITTRLAGLQRYGLGLKVNKVDPEEARAILEENAKKSVEDAKLIVQRLDGLPLALAQAGSFLQQTNMAVRTYVEHYDITWKELSEQESQFPLQEYTDRNILTTWTLSYEQVKKQSEEAAGLLRLWGFLDHQDLWYELIAFEKNLVDDIIVPEWLFKLSATALKFSGTVGLLSRYSLVDHGQQTSSHSMHAVLHEWCYHLSTESERSMLLCVTLSLIAKRVPLDKEAEYWKLQRRLLPHGIRACQLAGFGLGEQHYIDMGLEVPPWAFHSLGVLYADQGKLDQAEEMYERALKGREKTLGP
ncbi:uncharacterized protein K452DRAFT_46458, partial [Aplosporella prunicola CBS 121167]